MGISVVDAPETVYPFYIEIHNSKYDVIEQLMIKFVRQCHVSTRHRLTEVTIEIDGMHVAAHFRHEDDFLDFKIAFEAENRKFLEQNGFVEDASVESPLMHEGQ